MSADQRLEAAVEALGELILEQRGQIWRLKNEVERLRRYERGVREVAALRTHVSQVLAAITWAEDLEEARDLASRALRDGLDHDASPPTN